MWKDLILHSLISGISLCMNYFNVKRACEDNTSELVALSFLNFVMITITMCIVLLKRPIKVIDNRVDLK